MFHFTELKKLWVLFIKTKGVVIYRGNNNGGNNGYCRQKLRYNVQYPKNVGNHHY